MFSDGRSKKVVFLAHCLLNQNAISDGTAVYPAAFREMVDTFLDADVGIVQLPCPELCCLGLDRGDIHGADRPVVVENTRIRAQMQKEDASRRLGQLVELTMLQIEQYHRHGFQILGIIGANRSPNCGVETTSDRNAEVAGRGLFMQALHERLQEAGLSVPMLGIKASDDIGTRLQALLANGSLRTDFSR